MAAAGDLFADPIWDMMLDLYIASQRGQLTTVTNACVAADVPQTTGLRYIEKLTSRGLAVRYSHLKDKRMLGLELTPEGKAAMEDMLRELVRLLGEAGYRHEMMPPLLKAV
ncbi:hypothetical protein CDQ92_11195 [Sphingopyxis bauzanensis]|jgi:DNA-binding MarR family transcriptional regulator|uniref:HTH marR-type domain-containing protein n=1 Tax=Sphingopyxis bauzanensis TaxID=651663 RepID=A0A246JYG2_9SPHN|nr:hypothetical protein [Sphingopyxis bauzanensis]OWQ97562.1 hypothetical protein CDQ92_11195 [Sphingopyxis bauzanensis]GGJ65050.1 hypothetical protein GCM10011393_39200 [Sphingopyxis bauzanensis]